VKYIDQVIRYITRHFFQKSQCTHTLGNWLTALLMFSPWMYVILRVESLKSKYGLLFSAGGNDIYHFLKNKGPPLTRSGAL